jgi:mannose-6-phosphate isomerase-like protein (cupin superfamily)
MSPDPHFHIYLLLGQSNMAGRGRIEAQDQETHPRVLALDQENEWVFAADPLHYDKPIAAVGPGLTFGKTMAEHDPGVRIGLVPCAAGGSPITSWEPGGYWEQTRSHPYDDMLARARVAAEVGVLAGALWHQGESDSNEADAPLYEQRLVGLIQRLRADLGASELPFVCATLGEFVVLRNPWAGEVNAVLRRIAELSSHTACVEARGLGHKGDKTHFHAQAARELGRRYARAMIALQRRVGKVNLAEKLALFQEQWSPKIVGELNGQQVKLAKLQGSFVWHHHEAADELFLVLQGRLAIQLPGREIVLEEGEFLVVPRGVEHRPVAEEEAHVLLFEPASTLNTGNVVDAHTVQDLEWI